MKHTGHDNEELVVKADRGGAWLPARSLRSKPKIWRAKRSLGGRTGVNEDNDALIPSKRLDFRMTPVAMSCSRKPGRMFLPGETKIGTWRKRRYQRVGSRKKTILARNH